MRWVIPLWTILLLSAGCDPAERPSAEVKRGATPPLEDATSARIREAVHEPGARATLVNVWATWCTPCREEFPELLRVHRQYRNRGLRLVLVSADVPDSSELARRFLEARGVDFPTYLKREKDMEFIDGLDPRWSGALPATFVYDANGRLRSFHEGKTTAAEFESLVVSAMNPDDTRGKETVR